MITSMNLGFLDQLHITVVSDRVAKAFNRSGATRAMALQGF